MKQTILLLAAYLLFSSHELFLKSDTYFLKENSLAELYLYNGTFDQSENTITRERIISPQLIGPDYLFEPTNDDYYDKDEATYLRIKTGNSGTYVAGISTKPRVIKLSGEKFMNYLKHEGLPEVIMDRIEEGITNKPAREKYSKHVKSILQVGDQRTDHFAQELGYPIEFIPLKNPYSLTVGDQATFQLLYKGKPLPNKRIHISSRENRSATKGRITSVNTNGKGELSFKISNSGHWYLATIHMLEVRSEKLDYESNWATLTFEIKAD